MMAETVREEEWFWEKMVEYASVPDIVRLGRVSQMLRIAMTRPLRMALSLGKDFVVAATACLPYSDDGASGSGLFTSICSTEEEAVKYGSNLVLKLLEKNWMGEGEVEEMKGTIKASAEFLKTFPDLEAWLDEFANVVRSYCDEDGFYYNPGQTMDLHIFTKYCEIITWGC